MIGTVRRCEGGGTLNNFKYRLRCHFTNNVLGNVLTFYCEFYSDVNLRFELF